MNRTWYGKFVLTLEQIFSVSVFQYSLISGGTCLHVETPASLAVRTIECLIYYYFSENIESMNFKLAIHLVKINFYMNTVSYCYVISWHISSIKSNFVVFIIDICLYENINLWLTDDGDGVIMSLPLIGWCLCSHDDESSKRLFRWDYVWMPRFKMGFGK